jgi:hypothetical protein
MVDGREYQSDHVLPITISASRAWAEGVRGRFRSGQVVTAYVNPARPASAYLIHQLSFLSLIFVAFPVLMAGVLFWIARAQRRPTATALAHPVPILEANPEPLP